VSTVYHTTDSGLHWNPVDAKISSGVQAIAGIDASNVFVAASLGEISLGSAAAGFVNDRASDGVPFADLEVFAGNVFAARSGQILLRNPAATPNWNVVLDVSTAAKFNATWGSTATDFYAVGVQQSCSIDCGVLEHKVDTAAPVTKTIAGCLAFNDVWGGPNGAGGRAWSAVPAGCPG
jgi:hypothetical protein